MNNDTERELQEVSQKLKETTLQLSQAQEELKTVRQQLSLQLDAKEFMNSHHQELRDDLNLKLESEGRSHQREVMELTLEARDFKFKYEDTKEQFEILKEGEKMTRQDMERASSQLNTWRDKFLRLQYERDTAEERFNQEKQELQTTIQELKHSQEHLREPGELI